MRRAEATLASLKDLGRFLDRWRDSTAKQTEAEALVFRHLEDLEWTHGPDDWRSIQSQRELIGFFEWNRDFVNATQRSRNHVEALRRTKGVTAPVTRSALDDQSRLLQIQGDQDGGIALCEADLEMLNRDLVKNVTLVHVDKNRLKEFRWHRDGAQKRRSSLAT
jgi:hypothetical protein